MVRVLMMVMMVWCEQKAWVGGVASVTSNDGLVVVRCGQLFSCVELMMYSTCVNV